MKLHGWLWTLLPCAVVLGLAAWLRGAEYDEQYTLFLTSGVPRPDWPMGVFPAGLVRTIQAGHSGLGGIARDLRSTDVHPPLYFWLVSLWRDVFGHGLFEARLLSVLLGLGSLALTGAIARVARVPPVLAMLLTLGCYGFTYTNVVARGFALALLLLLGGVVCLLVARPADLAVRPGGGPARRRDPDQLSGGVRGAGVPAGNQSGGGAVRSTSAPASRAAMAASGTAGQALAVFLVGFLAFIPADLWWFLAQRDTRRGQFPPFVLTQSLARLAARFTGDILGGLPLYVSGAASMVDAADRRRAEGFVAGLADWRQSASCGAGGRYRRPRAPGCCSGLPRWPHRSGCWCSARSSTIPRSRCGI